MIKIDRADLPRFVRVRQPLERKCIEDIPAAVKKALESTGALGGVAGKKIAITAGSRGIANIATIIRTIVDRVRDAGGTPFIVPAMGSHGGANAEGQLSVLEGYGITEASMGCPIRSSMEVVEIGRLESGAPVYFDRNAYESDGVIVCNRVKPHTDFIAPNESGIVKMIAIGLGKEMGCSAMHSYGLAKSIAQSCAVSLQHAPIIAGVAIVENSLDQTYLIEGVRPEAFLAEDARLLKIAYDLAPHLPTDSLDLLVVKTIGKKYSGTGMDTKVIGRIRVEGIPEPSAPRIRSIVALRLDEHSYGNALGIGLADITTKELVDSIDYASTYSNLLPTTYLERGKVPVHMPTELEAIETAIATLGAPDDIKAAIIENTLQMETLLVTPPVAARHPELEVIERDVELRFDASGKLEN